MRVRPKCSQCGVRPADVDKGTGVYLCAKCEMSNIYDSMSARDAAYLKSELYDQPRPHTTTATDVGLNRNM